MSKLSRRELLAGSLVGLSACGSSRSSPPSLETRLQEVAPIEVPRLLVQEGHGVDAIARAAAHLAASRCISDSVDGLGSVSHALLGVAAAHALCAGQQTARAIPLLQAAWFVAREVQNSPYVQAPYHLPPPGPAATNLADALAVGDVAGADGWVAAHGDAAAPILAQAATANLGHLGHRAIFAASVYRLGGGTLLWRAAARYLATDRSEDDTDRRIAAALNTPGLPLSADNEAIRAAQALDSGLPPHDVAQRLVERATELLASLETVGFSTLHMVTAIRAVSVLLPIHPDPPRAVLAAATWIDRFREGMTELGALSLRRQPLAPQRGTAAAIAAAIQRRDAATAGALAQQVPYDASLRAWIADRAAHSGVMTVQHSVKLLASVPDTPAGRSVASRYLARSYVRFEPELEPLGELLTGAPVPT